MQLLKTLWYATLLSSSNVAFGFQSSPLVAVGSKLGTQLKFLGKHQTGFDERAPLLPRTTRFLSDQVEENDTQIEITSDHSFDLKTTVFLVTGQSLLIGVAAALAKIFNIPNFGV